MLHRCLVSNLHLSQANIFVCCSCLPEITQHFADLGSISNFDAVENIATGLFLAELSAEIANFNLSRRRIRIIILIRLDAIVVQQSFKTIFSGSRSCKRSCSLKTAC